jgi:hypothetical protein
LSGIANALEISDVVGEGQIRYLKNRPDPSAYTYESKVTISKASLESGVVEIQTCHKQLDPIRKVVILFNKDRIKDIQVRSLDGIAMAEVRNNQVILRVVQFALICNHVH